MKNIPQNLRDKLSKDEYYLICCRHNLNECRGRITWEHAFTYAGKRINEQWAIIPLCWHHHLGKGLNKRINRTIALERASSEDLKKYPKLCLRGYVKNDIS